MYTYKHTIEKFTTHIDLNIFSLNFNTFTYEGKFTRVEFMLMQCKSKNSEPFIKFTFHHSTHPPSSYTYSFMLYRVYQPCVCRS